jgi:hypothetical protein
LFCLHFLPPGYLIQLGSARRKVNARGGAD